MPAPEQQELVDNDLASHFYDDGRTVCVVPAFYPVGQEHFSAGESVEVEPPVVLLGIQATATRASVDTNTEDFPMLWEDGAI